MAKRILSEDASKRAKRICEFRLETALHDMWHNPDFPSNPLHLAINSLIFMHPILLGNRIRGYFISGLTDLKINFDTPVVQSRLAAVSQAMRRT